METYAWSVVNQRKDERLFEGTVDCRPDRNIIIHCRLFKDNIYTVTIEADSFEAALQEMQAQKKDGLFEGEDVVAYPSGF